MVLFYLIKEVFYNFFIRNIFVIYKNEWKYWFSLLLKKTRDVVLRLTEQAIDKYRNLSEEEKNKKREYGKNRYHNMAEE